MVEMTRYIYRLTIPIVFPAGLVPGGDKVGGNSLVLARNGQGNPVLRGTAVAGILRHAWASLYGYKATPSRQDDEVAYWFGFALGDDWGESDGHDSQPSPLRITDAEVEFGGGSVQTRAHNVVDRHSGAVRHGGLFSIEMLPPGAEATIIAHLHLDDSESDSEATGFCAELVGLINAGLVFGGHGARGVGMARLNGKAYLRRYNLKNLEDTATWLDASWQWRKTGIMPDDGDEVQPANIENTLRISFDLIIPRGQDICIGSGMGEEFTVEPQKVTGSDGKRYWRLPGSSLRGVFRAWFNRLAARDVAKGKCPAIADPAARYDHKNPATGEDVGWLFHSKEEREVNKLNLASDDSDLIDVVTCPVAALFGSLYGAGRIHIADALSERPTAESTNGGRSDQVQPRKHVAVDRITGGASEGFLFDHAALLPGTLFRVEMTIRDPEEHEVRWLADTLKALDLGLIRFGSSKSSGRLTLAAVPKVIGPESLANILQTIQPSEV